MSDVKHTNSKLFMFPVFNILKRVVKQKNILYEMLKSFWPMQVARKNSWDRKDVL